MHSISTVDMKELCSFDPVMRQKGIRALGDAFLNSGFVAVVNHGIDSELIREAYGIGGSFFKMPQESKQKYHLAESGGLTGFLRIEAGESLNTEPVELWHIGKGRAPSYASTDFYPRNVWPDEIPEFERVCSPLYSQMEKCGLNILSACAEYLGSPEDAITGLVQDGWTTLRLLYYPKNNAQRRGAARGTAHADIAMLTFFQEGTSQGLEVQLADGTWLPVETTPEKVVVGVGEMLKHLTNGLFKEGVHRIVQPSDESIERLTLPCFIIPRPNVSIAPLSVCIEKTGGEALFGEMTPAQMLAERLKVGVPV